MARPVHIGWMRMENKSFYCKQKKRKTHFVLMGRGLGQTLQPFSILSLSLSCYFAMQSESYLCLGTKSPLPWNSISVSRSTGFTFFWLPFFFFSFLKLFLFFISSLIASHFSVCTVQSAFAQCAGPQSSQDFFLSIVLF